MRKGSGFAAGQRDRYLFQRFTLRVDAPEPFDHRGAQHQGRSQGISSEQIGRGSRGDQRAEQPGRRNSADGRADGEEHGDGQSARVSSGKISLTVR